MGYNYRPLDAAQGEIRLLYLNFPTTTEAELSWSLEHVSIQGSQSPRFDAISYRWGQASDLVHIRLSQGLFQVPRSAESALRGAWQIASPSHNAAERAAFWIDAICINQKDLEEKAVQVAFMSKIYSKATRTLIMLESNSCCSTSNAFKEIGLVYEYIRKITQDFATLDSYLWDGEDEDQRRYRSSTLLMPIEITWQAVECFFAEEWFRRLWCIQEVALARRALCCRDGVSMDFEHVALTARWLISTSNWPKILPSSGPHYESAHKGIDNAACMWDQWKAGLAPKLDMLWHTSYWFETTNLLDKVYGFLGLWQSRAAKDITARPDHLSMLMPDYRKLCVEVYAQASRAAILVSDSLGILDITDNCRVDAQGDDFPSWIPRMDLAYSVGHCPALFGTPPRGACDGLAADLIAGTPWHILRVRGVIVSEVTETCIIPQRDEYITDDSKKFARGLRSLFTWIHATQSCEGCADEVEELLAMTLTAGSTTRISDKTTWKSIFMDSTRTPSSDFCESEETLMRADQAALLALDDLFDPDGTNSFAAAFTLQSRSRVIFRTRTRHIGVVKLTAQSGDILCILFGSRKPVVLRPVGEKWRFIGVAYVHGIMTGEYIRKASLKDSTSNEARTFDII